MGLLRASVIIYSDLQLQAALLGLTLLSYVDLAEALEAGRSYPLLYASGVRYVREPPGSEIWQSTYHAYGTKSADCEDLSAIRSAELWAAGETAAQPVVKRISPRLRHVMVQRANGFLEDPSVILGMRAERHPDTWRAEAAAHLAEIPPPIATPDTPLPFGMPVLADLERETA